MGQPLGDWAWPGGAAQHSSSEGGSWPGQRSLPGVTLLTSLLGGRRAPVIVGLCGWVGCPRANGRDGGGTGREGPPLEAAQVWGANRQRPGPKAQRAGSPAPLRLSRQGNTVELPEEENTPEKRVDRIFAMMDKVSPWGGRA